MCSHAGRWARYESGEEAVYNTDGSCSLEMWAACWLCMYRLQIGPTGFQLNVHSHSYYGLDPKKIEGSKLDINADLPNVATGRYCQTKSIKWSVATYS